MTTPNQPEIIQLTYESFGGHAEHWNILSTQADVDVARWLQLSLDSASFPFGLCQSEQQLPSDVWLLQGPKENIQISQIITVEDNKPKALKTAFPVFKSPYQYTAKISRILCCPENHEAVLRLELSNDNVIYGYDTLFVVNHQHYDNNTEYQVELNAWAYDLEAVPTKETMLIEDPAAIRHHRALNDILAAHDGKTPENMQQLLADWQPKSPEDLLPVTIDISKMVAYLFGDTIGQEDEAWFQGDIVGKSTIHFLDKEFVLYDVAIIREENSPAIIIRIAYPNYKKQFEIGQYIRGNLWIQLKIYDKTEI